MEDEPLVSVILATYNRPKLLRRAIESILNQLYKNFEIIVINDAGENVLSIIEALNKDSKIKYICHENNKGLSSARNTGLQNANGTWIAYLDDDDIFYENHLSSLIKFAQTSLSSVVYSDAYRAWQTLSEENVLGVKKKDTPYSRDFNREQILINNFIPVLCIFHRRSNIDKVGFFDESLKVFEDWDMWIRMSKSFSFSHLKKITCEFSWRDDGSTMSSSKHEQFLATRKYIYDKHPIKNPRQINLIQARQKYLDDAQNYINLLGLYEQVLKLILSHPDKTEILYIYPKLITQEFLGYIDYQVKVSKTQNLLERREQLLQLREIIELCLHRPSGNSPEQNPIIFNPISTPVLFNLLLKEDDISQALQKYRKYLSKDLSDFVLLNAEEAKKDHNLEFAEGLEVLAELICEYIEKGIT
jgi:glycosyltransferase involved in cell wall biosynthesis